MTIKLGITGGIGAGKSFICQILKDQYHLPVYHCDDEAKRINEQSASVRAGLIELVGPEVYLEKGKLNKALLANYLFASADHAARLASIVHPAVAQDFLTWAERQTSDIVVLESAILFESHFDKLVDYTINVAAPRAVRIDRAAQRDNTTAQNIEQRAAHQLTDEQRSALSHFTLHNDVNTDNPDNLKQQINKILKQLC
ncbi:MAG: dephospho-CoA kinase [Bacteroidales bacterium]|nr:dephospho-CoA kinase [Candidatus Physcousia equi]